MEKLKKDIKLLDQCIKEKWIPLYKEGGIDHGRYNCSLCKEYNYSSFFRTDIQPCIGCPIREFTCQYHCKGTPYVKLPTRKNGPREPLVKKELVFLIRLRYVLKGKLASYLIAKERGENERSI